MRRCVLTFALSAVMAVMAMNARPASAQSGTPRFSLAGGLVWMGSYPIGDGTADLLQNTPGTPPPTTPLFRAASTFESVAGIEGRVGIAITPRLTVEVGASWSRPTIGVAITDDREAASVTFDGETVSQYVIDVSLLWELPLSRTARLRPFVIGGGGYLRQLHEDRTLVETGQLYHAGGGARLFFRGAAGGRAFGLRGDVQAAFRRGGIEFENERRVLPTATVLVFFGF